jgi:hypothetical protein
MLFKKVLTTITILLLAISASYADNLNVEFVSAVGGPTSAVAVSADGNTAYIGTGALVCVIDISNKNAPVLQGKVYTLGIVQDIAVVGEYAYVADYYAGLQIISVSDPANPALVGSFDTYRAGAVAVVGDYAYVADAGRGLQIINVTDPANPTLVGSYDTSGDAYDVAVVGDYAYVADAGRGLQIINVTDPANPTLVGSYDTSGIAYGVAVVGDYAYVADAGRGLQIINVTDPANPTLVGSYDTSGSAYGVAVVGDYAYVADAGRGLQIISVTEPANPTLAGSYDTSGYAYSVAVVGEYAYVADRDAGLQIIRVTDPANPTLVGNYDTSGYAYGVSVVGDYAYIADHSSGLQIISVTDPANPTLTGSFDTPGEARGVSVVGDLVYVADADGGLCILRFTGLASGIVTLDSGGPPTWTYTLTHETGEVSSWTYNGTAITGADVTGTAADNGWTVASQTETSVRFSTSTPLTSGSVTGFVITGSAGGLGSWTCGGNSGGIDGPLPVELSSFTATSIADGVQLKWRTETETNNLGFNVYRSTTRDGELTKINPAFIKGYGTDATPHDYTFIDETAQMDLTYFYQIEDVDFSGKTNRSKTIEVTVGKIIEVTVDKPSNINLIPEVTALMQNYPNPFNPETWIPYQLAYDSSVMISIYNARGQVIRTISLGNKNAGIYVKKAKAAYWDGRDSLGQKVASGVYFYQLQAGDFNATRRMVIVK